MNTHRAHVVYGLLLAFLFSQLPWLFYGNILIGAIGKAHNFTHGFTKFPCLIGLGYERLRCLELTEKFRRFNTVGKFAVKFLTDKARTAASNIDYFSNEV